MGGDQVCGTVQQPIGRSRSALSAPRECCYLNGNYNEGRSGKRIVYGKEFSSRVGSAVEKLLWVVSIAEARPSFVEPSTVTHVEIPSSIASAPSNQHSHAAFIETAAKWVFNYLSTTANVLKGCVYKNRMINVCITNQKLFRRYRSRRSWGWRGGWWALLATCFVSHEVRKYPRCGICK